ncbi:hypothetical protein PR202_ga02788 [Eleusine coracana subsp. coracana]|uniref:Uncharacterized protein n=1 Tax=Eleusine coracana subsp. coracana TaxID=191504 RepID=A0AAV5BNL0_ELECO|nr:hypothetical protein QOZ80_2AG0146230 [Eleusine coracana subsp. coracana]GJM86889.1 hypothetical protein PR202_ga02788 [Eleusine coracana subsp. coracana]
METQRRVQQFRTPMDSLSSLASSFFSLPSSSSSAQQGSTFLLLPLPLAAARALSVLRRLLLLATHAFIALVFMLLSVLAPSPPPTLPQRAEPGSSPESSLACAAGRALGHVLSVACRLPVSSRKYELVRGLAERLLDDNVRAEAAAVNRAALAGAFARALRRLERAAGGGDWWPGMERAVRAGVQWLRRPASLAASMEDEGFVGGPAAEKLAAELLWIGQKMAECGAARDAVAQFGAAGRLGCRAIVAEPTLQVSLLRLAVFLFKHANSSEFEQSAGGKAVAEQRMAMLRSWLPLLCRGSNGTDAPVLSSRERSEMVGVLEELIDKLSWEQQEEILALWLHHFAGCPDTDWPNLETCFTRWYAESRSALLAE